MNSKTIEVTVGVFVALGFAALLMLAMKVGNLTSFDGEAGYSIMARFDNIGGLKPRSPVKMAGVVVGRVGNIDFDNETFEAVVELKLQARFDKMPADTSASIFTSGLLGEQYVGLEAGGEEEVLKQGDTLQLTQSAIVLEQLIGQFLYNQGEGEK